MDKYLVPLQPFHSASVNTSQPVVVTVARPHKRLKRFNSVADPSTSDFNSNSTTSNNAIIHVNTVSADNIHNDVIKLHDHNDYLSHLGESVVEVASTHSTDQPIGIRQSAINAVNHAQLNTSFYQEHRHIRHQTLQLLQCMNSLPIHLSSINCAAGSSITTDPPYIYNNIINNPCTNQQQLVLCSPTGKIDVHDFNLLYNILMSNSIICNNTIDSSNLIQHRVDDTIKLSTIRTPMPIHSLHTSHRTISLIAHNPHSSMPCLLIVGKNSARISVYSTIDYTLITTVEYTDTGTSIPDHIIGIWQMNDNTVYIQVQSKKLIRYSADTSNVLINPRIVKLTEKHSIVGVYHTTLHDKQVIVIYDNGTIQLLNTRLTPVSIQSTYNIWNTFKCCNTNKLATTGLIIQSVQHPYIPHIFSYCTSSGAFGLIDGMNKLYCTVSHKYDVKQISLQWHSIVHSNILLLQYTHIDIATNLTYSIIAVYTYDIQTFTLIQHDTATINLPTLPIYTPTHNHRCHISTHSHYPNIMLVSDNYNGLVVLMPHDNSP